MITFPNAKINIGLHVIGKRADGFHDIESVICPIGLSDILEINEGNEENTQCQFIQTGIEIEDSQNDNLCIQAYNLLNVTDSLPPVTIHLHKIIPVGAGLGGGSSDAAFTIKGINKLFDLQLSRELMVEYAGKLGSDCPFFIGNNSSFAKGRGDLFEDLPLNLDFYSLVVVNSGIHINTGNAYGEVNQFSETGMKNNIGEISSWKRHFTNDFEENIFSRYPEIGEIKDKLYKLGAIYASMTGSGSSVFGFFEKRPETKGIFSDHFVWTST